MHLLTCPNVVVGVMWWILISSLSIWGGEYNHAVIPYACNPMIENIRWIKSTLLMVLNKNKLSYLQVGCLGYLFVGCWLNTPCFLLTTWHGTSTFYLVPVLLVALAGHPHIYNSSIDCLVYLPAGHYHVLSRRVTLGH